MLVTIDVKLKLLAGMPIYVTDFGDVEPLTLKQIVEYGYEEYQKDLSLLSVRKEHFMKDPPKELNNFDMLMLFGDEEVLTMLKRALSFFLQDNVQIIKENHVIAVGSSEQDLRLITRNNFSDLQLVIQLQNYVKSIDENMKIINKNERAKKIKERLENSKTLISRIKAKENSELETDFFDLISAITAKSNNISKLEVFDLTIFQIYEEFKRLNHIDQYETGISAMLQGAKNVKLNHWSSKIN